jgi:hypothetical protein
MAKVQKTGQEKKSQKKNIVLLGVIVGSLVLIAVLVIVLSGGSEMKTPSEPMAREPIDRTGDETVPSKAQPVRRSQGISPPTDRIAPTPPARPVVLSPPPALSAADHKLYAAAADYLSRYDLAVESGTGWAELSRWAAENGLYVEAYHCARYAGMPTGRTADQEINVLNTPILISESTGQPGGTPRGPDEAENWQIIDQKTFEKKHTLKSRSSEVFSREQLVSQLEELQPSDSSAAQSRIAALLVQVDSPHGRKLYEGLIDKPNFYDILVRAMRRAYFSDLPEEQAAKASWFHCPPINLWLVRQLIAYAPSGGNPVAPVAPAQPTGQPQPSASAGHKLLVLRVLARRGGIIGAQLTGDLLQSDADGSISQALASGTLSPEIFARFTGAYAEPLIKPLGQALQKQSSQPEAWSAMARLTSRLFNPRAASEVFASAQQANLSLDAKTAFFLAASGEEYAIQNLLMFAQAGKLTWLDVPAVIELWTDKGQAADRSFWNRLAKFVPILGRSTRAQPTGQSDSDATGLPGQPTPLVPAANPYGQQQEQAFRPVERSFRKTVATEAAKQLLMGLGQLPAPTEGPTGASPPGYPGRPQVAPTADPTGQTPQQLKRDAVRALVSLYDKKLSQYYLSLLSDPSVAGFARLGLCLINERNAVGNLITQFQAELNEPTFGLSSADDDPKTEVSAGKIAVLLDAHGLATAGITTRDALVYFDNPQAAGEFHSALTKLIANQTPLSNPEAVVKGANQIMLALGRWQGSAIARALEDLIGSTGNFGLGADGGQTAYGQGSNHATQLRRRTLEVLGQIGDEPAMDVILNMATYGQDAPELCTAARLALAKRGYPLALDMFIDILDPDRKDAADTRTQDPFQQALRQADPSLQSMSDVALIAIARTRNMSDSQADRILRLVTRLGQQEQNNSSRSGGDLQERLMLTLLENGHSRLLNGLAQIMRNAPPALSSARRAASSEPYYWDRLDSQNQDKAFVAMIEALRKHGSFDDEQAVVELIKAIVTRQEVYLLTRIYETSKDLGNEVMKFSDTVKFNTSVLTGNQAAQSGGSASPYATERQRSGEDTEQAPPPQLDLPSASRRQLDTLPHLASLMGIDLVASFRSASAGLKSFNDLQFFKCPAFVARLHSGDVEATNDLIAYLADPASTNSDPRIRSLALELLEQQGGVEFLDMLGKIVQRSSDSVWQLRLADSAVLVTSKLWQDQMTGKNMILSDMSRISPISLSWRTLAQSSNVSQELADRLIIVLSACQADPNTLGTIQKLLRDQIGRGTPISEQAVGCMAQVLSGLVPMGNKDILNLYEMILTTPNRPAGRYARTAAGKTPQPPAQSQVGKFVYKNIAPLLISALAAMQSPESALALQQLARTRTDLLGEIAVTQYQTNPALARTLLKQAIFQSRTNPETAEQARLALTHICVEPTNDNMDLIIKAIIAGHQTVSDAALNQMDQWIANTDAAQTVDFKTAIRSMLISLVGQQSIEPSQFQRIADHVMKLATPFAIDPDIARMIGQVEKAKERAKNRTR